MPTCLKKSERGDDRSGGVLDAPAESWGASETPAQSSSEASETMFESSVGFGSMAEARKGENDEICAEHKYIPL